MTRIIRVKQILKLRAAGLSRSAIARSLHCSKTSVVDVFSAADSLDISYQDIESQTNMEAYTRLFPQRGNVDYVYPEPDWEYIHKELAKVGVTLKLLYEEYRDRNLEDGKPSMSYDNFAKRYRKFTISNDITSRVGRPAGRVIEVDWAGPTINLVDPTTGEVSKVYLFVGCLPFSRMVYVEPRLDMKQESWLRCHVHMFSYFGGVTPCLVPDNLKTGVIKHPKQGEIVLNEQYEELALHYGTAILPGRVRAPKDKPSAENEVWQATRYIIAALRNKVFTDFNDIKSEVYKRMDEWNDTPFTKRDGTRRQVFNEIEKQLLRPLPERDFEIATWIYNRKVQKNCHVVYNHNFYSVDYSFVGKDVDLRICESTIEIYSDGSRLCTHELFPQFAHGRYSTHQQDLPKDKQYEPWNTQRIVNWAENIGPNTTKIINRILEGVEYHEQGYNACLSVLKLSRTYSAQRLEAACLVALNSGVNSPRYAHIEPILKTNQDKILTNEILNSDQDLEPAGYIRGSEFYKGL